MFLSAVIAALLLPGVGVTPATAAQIGSFVCKWGSYGSGDGQFVDPKQMAFAGGYVYVVEFGNHRVQKFEPCGPGVPAQFVSKWGTLGDGIGQFDHPEGIAAFGGSIYVADTFNNRIQVFDLDGNPIGGWGSKGNGPGQFNLVAGIAVDNNGNVYTADVNETDRIQMFDGSGGWLNSWGGNGDGSGPCEFFNPEKLAVDAAGNIFVADHFNHRIVKIIPGVTCVVFAGVTGDPGDDETHLKQPHGVAVDRAGNVYVADTDNQRIMMYDAVGTFVTTWGSYGSGSGQFITPIGMAVDGAGRLYVAEFGGPRDNHRIQVFNVPQSAPLGTNNTVTTAQDTPYVFTTTDFGFGDPGDAVADSLESVKITTLPGGGSLTNGGTPVGPGSFVSAADIAGGNFVFTPAAGASGEPYASFTFQVKDTGGSVYNLDVAPNTMLINVIASAPVAPPPAPEPPPPPPAPEPPPAGDPSQSATSNVNAVLQEGGKVASAPVLVSWSATDSAPGATPLVHQIQRRRIRGSTPGAWRDRATVTGVQSIVDLAGWRKYQYQVRTQDLAGSWGPWVVGNPIKLLKYQEPSFSLGSGWSLLAQTDAMGRQVASSSSASATATLNFMGNGVALVAPTGTGQGTLEVCIDPGSAGESCRVVDLGGFTPSGARRLVAAFAGLSQANHVLRVTAFSGSVAFDAAIVTRTSASPV